MAEKILNTRILMKVDTLENWNKSTLPLKKGELAIATVAATAGTGLAEPVCMIKIGEDGVKTFKDLEWNLYAKASDVLAACKSEDALKTFINGVIADAGIASNDAMEALAGRVTTAEGKITTLEGTVGNAEGGLVKNVADNAAAIEAIEGRFGAETVSAEINAAIAALNLGTTYAAKAIETTVSDHIADTVAHVTTSDKTKWNGALQASDVAAGSANGTIAVKGTDIAVTGLGSAAFTESSAYDTSGAATTAEANAKAYAKEYADGLAGNYDASGAAATAESNAKAYAKSYADGLAGNYDASGSAADALQDAKDYTDAEMTRLVGDKTVTTQISEAITGLDLANTYDAKGAAAAVDSKLTTHISEAEGKYETKTDASAKLTEAKGYTDTEVAKVQGEVDALEELVGTLPEGTDATTVVGYIDAKTANIASDETVGAIDDRVKAIEDDYLKKADKDELAGDISELSGLIGGTEVSVQIENAIKVERERAEGIESGLRTDVDAIKEDYLKAADKEALQTQINTIMNNPDAEGAINSINEFTKYVEDHGEIADGFRTDINKNKDDIAAEVERATGVEGGLDTRLKAVEAAVGESGSVAGDIADALAEAKKYTDDEVKELANGAVATNAGAIAALEEKVGDKKVSEQITDVTNPLDARIVELEKVDHDHSNKTVLDGISAEKVTVWDAKVDDVTAVAGSGLKATRTGNAVAIEFDDSITFVFDCGGSGVVAE